MSPPTERWRHLPAWRLAGWVILELVISASLAIPYSPRLSDLISLPSKSKFLNLLYSALQNSRLVIDLVSSASLKFPFTFLFWQLNPSPPLPSSHRVAAFFSIPFISKNLDVGLMSSFSSMPPPDHSPCLLAADPGFESQSCCTPYFFHCSHLPALPSPFLIPWGMFNVMLSIRNIIILALNLGGFQYPGK